WCGRQESDEKRRVRCSRKPPKSGNMGKLGLKAQALPVIQCPPAGSEGSATAPRPVVRSQGMDGVELLLDSLRQHGLAAGNFLGLLHVLIGRRLTKADGTPVSPGLTWRAAADLLKRLRWDKASVRELGLDPDAMP